MPKSMTTPKAPASLARSLWMKNGVWCALLLCGGLALQSAICCTVPVFRYALDHWEADPYLLEVPLEVARDPDTDSLLRRLRSNAHLNLDMRMREEGASASRLWHPAQPAKPIWEGELTREVVDRLTDSPARKAVVENILSGDSVVWVLIESADEEKNSEAAARVEKRMRYLEQVASIPEQDPFDPESKLGPGPELRVGFSMVRIPHGSKEEALFVQMLAGEALNEFSGTDEPLLAAVFGRGRVLGAWTADRLDDVALDDACLFLLGACSCQVKQQNPGWDLMLDVDWRTRLVKVSLGAEAGEAPPASSAATGKPEAPRGPETVVIDGLEESEESDVPAAPAPPVPPGSATLSPLAVVAGILVVLAGALLFWNRRQTEKSS